MRRLLAGMVISAGLLLASCSHEPAVEHGTIVDMRHKAAWDEMWMMPVPAGKGVVVMVPEFTHHDESWEVRLDDGQHQGWLSVDETTYHSLAIGDSL